MSGILTGLCLYMPHISVGEEIVICIVAFDYSNLECNAHIAILNTLFEKTWH